MRKGWWIWCIWAVVVADQARECEKRLDLGGSPKKFRFPDDARRTCKWYTLLLLAIMGMPKLVELWNGFLRFTMSVCFLHRNKYEWDSKNRKMRSDLFGSNGICCFLCLSFSTKQGTKNSTMIYNEFQKLRLTPIGTRPKKNLGYSSNIEKLEHLEKYLPSVYGNVKILRLFPIGILWAYWWQLMFVQCTICCCNFADAPYLSLWPVSFIIPNSREQITQCSLL